MKFLTFAALALLSCFLANPVNASHDENVVGVRRVAVVAAPRVAVVRPAVAVRGVGVGVVRPAVVVRAPFVRVAVPATVIRTRAVVATPFLGVGGYNSFNNFGFNRSFVGAGYGGFNTFNNFGYGANTFGFNRGFGYGGVGMSYGAVGYAAPVAFAQTYAAPVAAVPCVPAVQQFAAVAPVVHQAAVNPCAQLEQGYNQLLQSHTELQGRLVQMEQIVRQMQQPVLPPVGGVGK